MLKQLEEGSQSPQGVSNPAKIAAGDIVKQPAATQMSFFQLDDPLLSQVRDRLLDVNVDNLTPIQALNILNDLQGLLTGK